MPGNASRAAVAAAEADNTLAPGASSGITPKSIKMSDGEHAAIFGTSALASNVACSNVASAPTARVSHARRDASAQTHKKRVPCWLAWVSFRDKTLAFIASFSRCARIAIFLFHCCFLYQTVNGTPAGF